MRKRILSLWLALCMIASLIIVLPVTASAASSGQCGDNVYWVLDNGTLTISGSGDMYDYSTSQPPPWQSHQSNIKNILIGKDITSIGGYAFGTCIYLISVTIPDSIITIGEEAFTNCENLTSVTIPTSVKTIGDNAFFNCKNLTSIIIPDSVATLGESAFEYCSSLTIVIIGNSVTSISHHAFYGCSSLSNIIIGNKVKSIGDDAFHGCESLTSITIPDGVISIAVGAFADCSKLTSITISESVKIIDYEAFYGCTSLVDISVNPQNDEYCSLDGNLYDKKKTELVLYAFGKSDTSFIIPNSVISIGFGAFYRNSNLKKIEIPNSVKYINGISFAYCTALTNIELPDSVTFIGDRAFERCDNLKNVYYTGTQDQWNRININSGNTPLTSATIHYNSIGPITGNMIETITVNNNTVSVGIKNISNTDYNSVVLLVGVYDKNNRLYDIKTVPMSNFVSGYTNDNIQVYFDSIPQNCYIKAFIWEALTKLNPLSDYRKLYI